MSTPTPGADGPTPEGCWKRLVPDDKPEEGYYWWKSDAEAYPRIAYIYSTGMCFTNCWSEEQGPLCGEWLLPKITFGERNALSAELERVRSVMFPAATAPFYDPADLSRTCELLTELNAEFYNGPLAHADAFRVLPRVVIALKQLADTRAKLAAAEAVIESAKNLLVIVEGVRNERWSSDGRRLKDTSEWCAFYCALAKFNAPPRAEGRLTGEGPGYSNYAASDY